MTRILVMGVSLLCLSFGCGGGNSRDVPSCQQAIVHYYDSGCSYFELSTGDPISSGDMLTACRDLLTQSPSGTCDRALDNWLICTDEVPNLSTTNEDCDCSVEQERILTDC